MFCVYLTIYRGNKLPPFYIGSTSTNRIETGYRGSVASKMYRDAWANELKSNPRLFKTIIISEYSNRNVAYLAEERIQRKLKVVENPLYVNEAYANSRFNMTGKVHSEETKKKMAESHTGMIQTKETITKRANSNKGKIRSEASRNKISESRKEGYKNGTIIPNRAMLGRKHSEASKIKMKNKSHSGAAMKANWLLKDFVTCPHCDKSGRQNMKRYHFDNCKSRCYTNL